MAQGPAGEPVANLARFSRGVAAEMRGVLSQIGRDVHALRAGSPLSSTRSLESEPDDRIDGLKRRVREAQELVTELGDLGEIDHTEPHAELDLHDLARTAVRSLAPQLERTGVDLSVVTVPDTAGIKVPVRMSPRAAAFLVRTMIAQAIAATSRGNKVQVTVVSGTSTEPTSDLVAVGAGARLLVDDAGASLPANSRRAFTSLEVEPSTFGRPDGVSLYICSEIAAWQGALLELGDAPLGGLRVGLHLPRFA